MMKFCLAAFISICTIGFADQESTSQKVDASYDHIADGKVFLEPLISSEIKKMSGQSLLDVGSNVANWTIMAAENGATVCGVNPQKALIEKAQIAVAQAGMEKQVSLVQSNVEKLPFEAKNFDAVISVNVGCGLTKTMHTASQDSFVVSGLDGHFMELARVLKENGRAFVTADASFDIVFTYAGNKDSEVNKHIDEVLTKIGGSDDSALITASLGELTEVIRATFVKRDDKLTLVTDEKQLKLGEPIWRKTPEGVIANYYHSEEEYLVAFKNAGLTCEEIKRPCFFGSIKYHQHRSSVTGDEKALGAAYADHNPFTIYYLTKKV